MPAWLADALTLTRALLALVLAVVLAGGRLAPAAILLSLAWLTDFADGRVARAGRGRTRLGGFDLPADTLVGAGVLVGLAADGAIPAPVSSPSCSWSWAAGSWCSGTRPCPWPSRPWATARFFGGVWSALALRRGSGFRLPNDEP